MHASIDFFCRDFFFAWFDVFQADITMGGGVSKPERALSVEVVPGVICVMSPLKIRTLFRVLDYVTKASGRRRGDVWAGGVGVQFITLHVYISHCVPLACPMLVWDMFLPSVGFPTFPMGCPVGSPPIVSLEISRVLYDSTFIHSVPKKMLSAVGCSSPFTRLAPQHLAAIRAWYEHNVCLVGENLTCYSVPASQGCEGSRHK